MTAKEYLLQAQRLDMQINTKLEQIESLTDLATNCTSVINDMPRHSGGGKSRTEDIIVKVDTLQQELKESAEKLIDLKCEIMGVIKQVEIVERQILLEKRYLCFSSWEQISADMNFSQRHTHRTHQMALKEIDKILKDGTKCH
ncbi:MAG: DUF1492 domain-containing protein [Eubacteriales bacterium]